MMAKVPGLDACRHHAQCEECRQRLGEAWGAYLDLLITVKGGQKIEFDEIGREVVVEVSLLEEALWANPGLRERFMRVLGL
ncbi:MAG TPA: hypothetical protein VHK27_03230 [Gammaproteobacteria bacterium]|nr:hypothetical protein [Gammaproteobacteria bacterium]